MLNTVSKKLQKADSGNDIFASQKYLNSLQSLKYANHDGSQGETKVGKLETEMKALDKYLKRMNKAKVNNEKMREAQIPRPEKPTKKWLTSS